MDIEITKKPFWAFDIAQTLESLETTEKGLIEEEVKKRSKYFGENSIEVKKHFIKSRIFLHQFQSPLIFILIIAGITTVFLGEWLDSSVIFLAVAVNTILGFYQENRAETALEKLRSYIKDRVRVIREGRENEINTRNLVPGDIIHLTYGTRVPADARLISLQTLSVDESILTGESMPVSKTTDLLSEGAALTERKNMLFAGTMVIEGYAMAVVTSVGMDTEIGKIARILAESRREKIPLQKAIWRLAWVIAAGIAALTSLIFVLGISRGESFFDMFLISVAVAVCAIPEALPVVLTVVLAVGVEQLAKRKGIVKNLAAAETLGSTTVIITDKTGTLTEAKMRLVDVLTLENILEGKTRDHHEIKSLEEDEKEILTLAYLNTDTVIENPEEAPEKWRIGGRPLETNIVQALAARGVNPQVQRNLADVRLILPFSSVNKFSASLVSKIKRGSTVRKKNKNFYIFLGAPDTLLSKSKLTKEEYIAALSQIEKLSEEGKRILGVGIKQAGKTEKSGTFEAGDLSDITFSGVLAFYDPIREDVPQAIKEIEESGVKVIMSTGDLKGTAVSVARQLGWEVSEGTVLTGEELSRLSDEQVLENLYNIKIYARVTPHDKLRIAKLFRQKGEITGMTGDGVNDAPSLKEVDIGIAVGSGSDVAKDVADLVLLDDDFKTIAAAIEQGRSMLNNIRKSFIYLMSNSFDEVVLIGGGLLFALPLPLTALQIIWVNFFTGSIPALSYAFDDFIDREKMTARSARNIFDSEVKMLTIGVGLLTSVFLFLLYWVLLKVFEAPLEETRTFLFLCFSSYILFISYSFRSLKKHIFSYNIFSNKLLNIGVFAGIALIAATIYVPFLNGVFSTVPLSFIWILGLFGWLILNILLVEAVKWFYRNI